MLNPPRAPRNHCLTARPVRASGPAIVSFSHLGANIGSSMLTTQADRPTVVSLSFETCSVNARSVQRSRGDTTNSKEKKLRNSMLAAEAGGTLLSHCLGLRWPNCCLIVLAPGAGQFAASLSWPSAAPLLPHCLATARTKIARTKTVIIQNSLNKNIYSKTSRNKNS